MNLRACILLAAAIASASAIVLTWLAGADDAPSAAPRIEVTDARFRVIKPDGSIVHHAMREGPAAEAESIGADAGAELARRGGPDFFTG